MLKRILLLILPAMWLMAPAAVHADVRDGANIFSASAVDHADAKISQLAQKYGKDLVIETYAKVPDDELEAQKRLSKEEFFHQWLQSRASAQEVNGVFVLICMDPKYIEVRAGAQTQSRGIFTAADLNHLRSQMQTDFHQQQYDQGLQHAVEIVERAYTANIHARGSNYSGSNQGAPVSSYPSYPSYPSGSAQGFGFGSLVCLVIGGLLIFSLLRSVLSGRSSYGGNRYFGGGYGGGGYGGGYGGGGGGFGSGLMGGLLGGVLGGEADRWMHGGNQSGGYSQGGGGFTGGGGGSGGGFDSGPSDMGQGFGGAGGGGDFGSSGGGGGDSGGSGGGF